ncbi:tripartite tricarboxylate transporter TctB family protein [Pseudothermotoga sp. U03pept]|uniref:tripartite tricarboxylate transporter TctB family protein n=1 Tax=Pseudothermotoga sp. U03pept TaxID=3447012 RepID=UPI003F0B4232
MKDLVFSIIAVIFSILLLIEASKLPEGVANLPGPGFFPTIIGVVILVLSVALLVLTVRNLSKGKVTSKLQGDWGTTILFIGIATGYVGLWGRGNFMLNTTVMIFLLQMISGAKWYWALIGSISLSSGIYLLFGKVFHALLF